MYGGFLNAPEEMLEEGALTGAAGARGTGAGTGAGLIAGGMLLARSNEGASFTAPARRTSSFVTRPPLPLPATAARSTPCSRASLHTAGDDGESPGGPAATRCSCGGAAAATGSGAEGGMDFFPVDF